MRVVVTGRTGQISRALQELAARRPAIELVALGRPDMDLTDRASVAAAIIAARPDAVINAAAYTAVDKAEDDEAVAQAVNADGAAYVAEAAGVLGIPIIHLSTDYVFDGQADRPYVEADTPAPLNAYGRTKLAGERVVAHANPRHAIMRTSWVHSPFGPNFVVTMLRLAQTRPEISVVADQIGAPTSALEIADALLRAASRLAARPDDTALTGTFHLTAAGSTSWAGLAGFVFEQSRSLGGPPATVRPIETAVHPTKARRPLNSRLGGTRLRDGYGIEMAEWQVGVAETVRRILSESTLLS
jgi:dTDP-4-dehydrorhamnose reductase